jgi:hypothetical protein
MGVLPAIYVDGERGCLAVSLSEDVMPLTVIDGTPAV